MFNVGDKVVCVEGLNGLKTGDQYEVLWSGICLDGSQRIGICERLPEWYAWRFRLISDVMLPDPSKPYPDQREIAAAAQQVALHNLKQELRDYLYGTSTTA